MKITILGSSGQVGAHLVKHLNSKNYSVFECDIVKSQDEDLRYKNKKIDNIIKNSDFVFFLAFDVGGSRYLNKYQHTPEFIENNLLLMTNTFSMLNEHNKPFIFASSQMSNMSYSPYGVLKAVGENYTRALDGRIVKFWNVYGVEHDMSKSHVITDFIIKACDTGKIDMLTDGQEEREFLYAEDCCEALESVMLNYEKFTKNSELNITSFESNKIIDVANIIAEKFNAKVFPSKLIDTVQMNKKNEADKLILEYWKPKISLNEGINKVIEAMYD
jgi:nucleoside-diphosphate-sugar epimerase